MENKLSLRLAKKYSAYLYVPEENDPSTENTLDEYSQLIDAFFTECNLPYARHSRPYYTQEIEDDIKEIIKQNPLTIHCNIGHLRCRDLVTPLGAACHNHNIPVHMIEFLLQNGADANLPVLVNGKEVKLIHDLKLNESNVERYEQIKELFLQYGGVNIKPAKR